MSNGQPVPEPQQQPQLAMPLAMPGISTNALATIATIIVAIGGAYFKQQQDHATTTEDLSTSKTQIASVQNDVNDLSSLKTVIGELKQRQFDQSKQVTDNMEGIHSLQASVNRLERLLLTPRKTPSPVPSPSP